MATVTIEVVAGVDTMTRQRTVTGAHLVRFVDALRRMNSYAPEVTDLEVLEFWADSVFRDAKEITRNQEQTAASAAVTDIDFE